MRGWSWAVGPAMLMACSEAIDTEVMHMPHSNYHYSPGFEPCGGTPRAVDDFVVFAAKTIGLEDRLLGQVSYYWLSREVFSTISTVGRGTNCQNGFGCAVGANTFGTIPIFDHEVAHGVSFWLHPDGVPFLNEGLATMLDPHNIWWGDESRDPRPILFKLANKLDAREYRLASFFVAYLIQVHGSERFAELYRSLSPWSRGRAWDRAFRRIYGQSVDEMVEAYLAATTCPADVAPLPPFHCTAPLVAAVDGVVSFAHGLECSDPEVVGGLRPEDMDDLAVGEWWLAVRHTFEIEVAGTYAITIHTPSDDRSIGQAVLRACGGCAWLPQQPISSVQGNRDGIIGDPVELRWFDVGRYAVELGAFTPGEASFRLELVEAGGPAP